MVQVVNRSACSPEFLIARRGSRLGGEPVQPEFLLTKAGGVCGREVRVGSKQAAIHVGQFVVHIANLEVAPHPVVLTVIHFHVELAQRRRHLFNDTVVAERRVKPFRIDSPE